MYHFYNNSNNEGLGQDLGRDAIKKSANKPDLTRILKPFLYMPRSIRKERTTSKPVIKNNLYLVPTSNTLVVCFLFQKYT